jgi:hypothetical protein
VAADQRVLDLMGRVADLVDRIGRGRAERVWHELEILALFDRCRSLHRGVLLLLSEGLVHEAVILGRPLFTDCLALAELANVDEKRRGSLVVGWALASWLHMKGHFLDRRSRGHDVTAELEALAEREREVRRYALDHGYDTKHWQPDGDVKRLADAHGRGDEYGTFLVTQMFVHGTTTVTSERYLQTDEGIFVVGAPAPIPKRWARDAGLWASQSMLNAARAACRLFGWAEPAELAELLVAIQEEGARGPDPSTP